MNWTNRRISKTNRWISSVNSKLKLKDDWLTKQLFIRLGGSEHRESYLNLKHFFLLVRRGNRRAISCASIPCQCLILIRPSYPSSHQVILLLCDHSCLQSLTLFCFLCAEFISYDSIRDTDIAGNRGFQTCWSMFIIQLIYSCLLKEIEVYFSS